MYCWQCGVKAGGNFCFQCGSPLKNEADHAAATEPLVPAAWDWEHDICYQHIVQVPEVRAAIASQAASTKAGVSSETFLEICDKLIPGPVSYAGVADVAQPFWAALGVRTGKERTETIDVPSGRTLGRALCSLARHGQTLQRVKQGETGCVLTATLPPSICTLPGNLTISLTQKGQRTAVTATTVVPGQAFDWGASQRCLARLFEDLQVAPATNCRLTA